MVYFCLFSSRGGECGWRSWRPWAGTLGFLEVFPKGASWHPLAAFGLAMILAGTVMTETPPLVTAAPLVPDAAAAFVRWVALASAAVLLFVSWPEVPGASAAEYYGCLLVASAGVSLAGRANDLV